MSVTRTAVLVKPDGLQRGLIGEIISRFEKKGLKLVGLKMVREDGLRESLKRGRLDYPRDANKPALTEARAIFGGVWGCRRLPLHF